MNIYNESQIIQPSQIIQITIPMQYSMTLEQFDTQYYTQRASMYPHHNIFSMPAISKLTYKNVWMSAASSSTALAASTAALEASTAALVASSVATFDDLVDAQPVFKNNVFGIYALKGKPVNSRRRIITPPEGALLNSVSKKKHKVKKQFIKSHTDIHKKKAEKIVKKNNKNIRVNQPAHRGARVRYTAVTRT